VLSQQAKVAVQQVIIIIIIIIICISIPQWVVTSEALERLLLNSDVNGNNDMI